jgi:hypothetical protein
MGFSYYQDAGEEEERLPEMGICASISSITIL